jgi:hypothetical protein
MNSENNTGAIALTITFTDPDLKSEERDDEVVRLLEELSDRLNHQYLSAIASHQTQTPAIALA